MAGETLGKFSGEKAGPIVRYTITRTGDQVPKTAEQVATLTVRSGGKQVASFEVPIYTWCGGVPWYFDLEPDCVAESVFTIEVPLAKDHGQNCRLRLSDFPVEKKSPAENEEEEHEED